MSPRAGRHGLTAAEGAESLGPLAGPSRRACRRVSDLREIRARGDFDFAPGDMFQCTSFAESYLDSKTVQWSGASDAVRRSVLTCVGCADEQVLWLVSGGRRSGSIMWHPFDVLERMLASRFQLHQIFRVPRAGREDT